MDLSKKDKAVISFYQKNLNKTSSKYFFNKHRIRRIFKRDEHERVSNFLVVPINRYIFHGSEYVHIALFSKKDNFKDADKNLINFDYSLKIINKNKITIDIPSSEFLKGDWATLFTSQMRDLKINREELSRYLKAIDIFIPKSNKKHLFQNWFEISTRSGRKTLSVRPPLSMNILPICLPDYPNLYRYHPNLPILISHFHAAYMYRLFEHIGYPVRTALNVIVNEKSHQNVLSLLDQLSLSMQAFCTASNLSPLTVATKHTLFNQKAKLSDIAQSRVLILDGCGSQTSCVELKKEYSRKGYSRDFLEPIYITQQITDSTSFINIDLRNYQIQDLEPIIERSGSPDTTLYSFVSYLKYFGEVDQQNWDQFLETLFQSLLIEHNSHFFKLNDDYKYYLATNMLVNLMSQDLNDFSSFDAHINDNMHLQYQASELKEVNVSHERDDIEKAFRALWNLYDSPEGAKHFPITTGEKNKPDSTLGFRQESSGKTVIFLNMAFFESQKISEQLLNDAYKLERYKLLFAGNNGDPKRKLANNQRNYAIWADKLSSLMNP